jgi:molecular chaperone HtpG
MSLHLERMLKQHGQGEGLAVPRVFEINPKHTLIRKLIDQSDDIVSETAHLLLDQARIIEGEAVPDPIAFASRLSQAMERGLV